MKRDDGFFVLKNPEDNRYIVLTESEGKVYEKIYQKGEKLSDFVSHIKDEGLTLSDAFSILKKVEGLQEPKGESKPEIFSIRPFKKISKIFFPLTLIASLVCIVITALLWPDFLLSFSRSVPLSVVTVYILFIPLLTLTSFIKAIYASQSATENIPCFFSLFYGIPYIECNSDFYIILTKKKRIKYLLLGILPVFLFLLVATIISYIVVEPGILVLFFFFTALYLKPFGKSDVEKIIEEIFGTYNIFDISTAYYKNKFLYNLFRKGLTSKEEKYIIVHSVISLLWFLIVLYILTFHLIPNLYLFLFESTSSLIIGAVFFIFVVVSAIWAMTIVILWFIKLFSPASVIIAKLLRKKKHVKDISTLKEYIKSVPIFSTLSDEEIQHIIRGSKILVCRKGDKIINQGDIGNEIYIILSGKVRVFSVDENGIETQLAELKERDTFGELSLLYNVKRTANCQSEEDSEILAISKNDFLKATKNYDGIKKIEDILRTTNILRKNPIFSEIAVSTLSQIIISSAEEKFNKGEVIIREGEPGDKVYIIKNGRCKIVKGERTVAEISDSEIFGEIAVLEHTRRTATVIPETDVTTLSLKEEDFWKILSKDLFLANLLEKLSKLRVSELREISL